MYCADFKRSLDRQSAVLLKGTGYKPAPAGAV